MLTQYVLYCGVKPCHHAILQAYCKSKPCVLEFREFCLFLHEFRRPQKPMADTYVYLANNMILIASCYRTIQIYVIGVEYL